MFEKIPTTEKKKTAEGQKNIYVYRDNSQPGRPIIFETVAEDILQADEKYKQETGNDPSEQSYVGCSIESLLEKQKKEFNEFLANIVYREGISWAKFAEREEKNKYDGYLKELDLKEEALRGQKILDLGAGNCFFASYCAKRGINSNVYSVDAGEDDFADKEAKKAIWTDAIRAAVEQKKIKALAQSLPFKSEAFNLVFVNSALPGRNKDYFGDLSMEDDLRKSYDEIARVLAPNGEARLQPFDADEGDEYFGAWATATKKKLAELSSEGEVAVSLEKIEESEGESYRIVIKKQAMNQVK